MKKLLFFAALAFIASCTPKTIATIPQAEFENLDTMVISAPRVDSPTMDLGLEKYNPSAKREIDLLHTKLDVRFDWKKEQVIGKATLKMTPFFHPIDEVTLDAKGFEFTKVALENGADLKYDYNGQQIRIYLNDTYKKGTNFSLYFDYVATPSASGGSSAITSDKGLFFINPRGEEAGKPQQIWTQGETEHNSRWFPTVDKPNERCTQEMYITVQDKFVTLSNGLLVKSTKNNDGTRTDYWNMDKPHAPYLFMLTVGEFEVVKDKWKALDVDYYVEEKYKDHARAIFPHTPEMLGFFSDKLDMEYPWQKYSQVVVRDYVSGAMENTTAVIFGEFMNGTDRDLIDELTNEKVVAHEMMHHWFGDYVTCESWSNLTLNEGFANYSEYLWLEHKYGKDQADMHWMEEFEGYNSQAMGGGIHPLIHFSYEDKEDMFDAHSYNKGGMVLHMLRAYLGDAAFFAGLNNYLKDNAFTAVEVDELRMAFEDTCGEDLNWFFNQWYLNQGHPNLEFSKFYNAETGNLELTVIQTQDGQRMPAIFQLPIDVDIYTGNATKTRERLFVNEREQTFLLPVKSEPLFVDFDPEKVLLAEKEESKTEEEYAFQVKNTASFANRMEGIRALAQAGNPAIQDIFRTALQDDFWLIRQISIGNIELNEETEAIIATLAKMDPHSSVRGQAVNRLGETANTKYSDLLKNAMTNDQSYKVQGAALYGLMGIDKDAALAAAKNLENSENSGILSAIAEIYVASGDSKYLPFFEKALDDIDGYDAITFMEKYGAVAANGDLTVMENAAKKLSAIGNNMVTSPFRRFAATKTLNDLYLAAHDKTIISEEESVKTSMVGLKARLAEMINAIKAVETDEQLNMFYSGFPSVLEP